MKGDLVTPGVFFGLALVISCAAAPVAQAQTVVTTLAGNGATGNTNGTGAAAQFNLPMGGARDSAGNLYTADYVNRVIRKITPTGVVTTYAGIMGVNGYIDGPAATAQFSLPRAIAVDSADNIYVFDLTGQRLRKITPAGIVSTVTSFSYSSMNTLGMAADAAGNIYLTDATCQCIRKVTPAGVDSVLAGGVGAGLANGTGAAAKFYYPQGLAVDSGQNVYVADTNNHVIRKITPAGVVTTFAGTGALGYADGPAASAQFYTLYGIGVDANGDVYVSDSSPAYSYIRKVTPAGMVSTVAGGGNGFADGSASAAQFAGTATGISVSGATIYVVDTYNHAIRKLKPLRLTRDVSIPVKPVRSF